MATSGSTDFTLTAQQVIDYALEDCGVLEGASTAASEDADVALRRLNVLLKGMQKNGPFLFSVQVDGSQTLTNANGTYSLTSTTPLRLLEVRYSDANDREIPMIPLTRTEYFELPEKTSSGPPTQYWYDADSQDMNIYVWPVKGTVTTESIEYTYQRKLEDVDSLEDNIDVPEEWLDTIAYKLAQRLLIPFGVKGERAMMINAMAERLWAEAMDYDREPMITFVPETRWRRAW